MWPTISRTAWVGFEQSPGSGFCAWAGEAAIAMSQTHAITQVLFMSLPSCSESSV